MSISDLGIIVRALGLNPTQDQVNRMIIIAGEEHVDYDRFEDMMLRILRTHMFEGELLVRDSEERILKAFRVS